VYPDSSWENPENMGTPDIDQLTAEETALLQEMRSKLTPEEGAMPTWTLMRFIRARKMKVDDAIRQFRSTQDFRESNPHADGHVNKFRENIRQPSARANSEGCPSADGIEIYPMLRLLEQDPLEGVFRTFCAHANFGHGKDGRPIYIERTGMCSTRVATMLKHIKPRDVIRRHIRQQELAVARMEEASAKQGRRIGKQILIFDLEGLSLYPNPKAMAIFKEVLKIDAEFYPETLGVHFLINAPFFFQGIWSLVRGWLDPVTATKFHILGKNYSTTLLEHIDASQLPVEYGGTSSFVLEYPRDELPEGEKFAEELRTYVAAEGAAAEGAVAEGAAAERGGVQRSRSTTVQRSRSTTIHSAPRAKLSSTTAPSTSSRQTMNHAHVAPPAPSPALAAATGIYPAADDTSSTVGRILLYVAITTPAVAGLLYTAYSNSSWEVTAKNATHILLLYILLAVYAF
jgi:hypothetical protein